MSDRPLPMPPSAEERRKSDTSDRRLMRSFGRRFSPPGAMSDELPEFRQARSKACAAVLAAIEEFERTTGRAVYGVHLHHVDATALDSPGAVYLREVSVLWHETQAEFLERDGVEFER